MILVGYRQLKGNELFASIGGVMSTSDVSSFSMYV